MKCNTCAAFESYTEECRRHAPTTKRFPHVKQDDWCCEHMSKVKTYEQKHAYEAKTKADCNTCRYREENLCSAFDNIPCEEMSLECSMYTRASKEVSVTVGNTEGENLCRTCSNFETECCPTVEGAKTKVKQCSEYNAKGKPEKSCDKGVSCDTCNDNCAIKKVIGKSCGACAYHKSKDAICRTCRYLPDCSVNMNGAIVTECGVFEPASDLSASLCYTCERIACPSRTNTMAKCKAYVKYDAKKLEEVSCDTCSKDKICPIKKVMKKHCGACDNYEPQCLCDICGQVTCASRCKGTTECKAFIEKRPDNGKVGESVEGMNKRVRATLKSSCGKCRYFIKHKPYLDSRCALRKAEHCIYHMDTCVSVETTGPDMTPEERAMEHVRLYCKTCIHSLNSRENGLVCKKADFYPCEGLCNCSSYERNTGKVKI